MRKYTPEERIVAFWNKVDKRGPNQCWDWLANKAGTGGYGFVKWDRKSQKAHRISWQLAHGAIPEGVDVLHTCDNPACVNPRHLFLGTDIDNAHDRDGKGRSGTCKLTSTQVKQIRQRYSAGGISQDALGKEYGVCQTTIGFIVRGETWR